MYVPNREYALNTGAIKAMPNRYCCGTQRSGTMQLIVKCAHVASIGVKSEKNNYDMVHSALALRSSS